MDDLDPYRTESQKQWKAWADHGYRKRYQPRSMLWVGAIVVTILGAGLALVFWLAATGRLPLSSSALL